MDKRSLMALVLITIIITGWLVLQQFNSVSTRPEQMNQDTNSVVDTKNLPDKDSSDNNTPPPPPPKAIETNWGENRFGSDFAPFAIGERKVITIETDLLTAKIVNQGAALIKWELKNYKKWDQVPSQLIWDNKGELYLDFISAEGKKIDTRDLYFEIDSDKDFYRIKGDGKLTLTAKLELERGKSIIKKITFHGNKYHVDHDIAIENMQKFLPPGRGFNYKWSKGISYQEKNSVDESNDAVVMSSMNGDIQEFDASDEEPVRTAKGGLTGYIDFTAIKTKYFGVAIIPQPYMDYDGTVDLSGQRFFVNKNNERRNSTVETYDMSYRIPYSGGIKKESFQVYIGPLDYDIVKGYGLEETVNFGWRIGIRQIGEYLLLPLFQLIHQFVPNYGIVLILFSLFIKFLLYPLSVQQMRSAQKMKLLGPELEGIRAKYKDDNTKQQQEIMKVYSQYGINPAGGCLPLLLQMPILFALWQFLRSAIGLRQEGFILWITDLSVPDVIIDLGFKLPIIGLDTISGLALLMGVTMFIQQKLTITDPRQKAMVYFMPVMFTILFSSFPGGLNLYYFVFNLLGIIQQVYINKFSKKKVTLEDLKKAPKKEGWLQKKMRQAQDAAAAQGKTIPNRKSNDSDGKQLPGKKKSPGKKSSPTQGGKKKK